MSHLWSGFSKASERGIPRVHPTQKPIVIMEWSLGFVPEAKVICDPYMGSGTTLVAAARLGRKSVGVELDPEFFDVSCRRVEEALREPMMFGAGGVAVPVQHDFNL